MRAPTPPEESPPPSRSGGFGVVVVVSTLAPVRPGEPTRPYFSTSCRARQGLRGSARQVLQARRRPRLDPRNLFTNLGARRTSVGLQPLSRLTHGGSLIRNEAREAQVGRRVSPRRSLGQPDRLLGARARDGDRQRAQVGPRGGVDDVRRNSLPAATHS